MKILSPAEITNAAANAGAAKAQLTASSTSRLLISATLAGAYIALGGILSMTLGFGFPEITAQNPALQRILSGAAFPIGLILVVVLGAELFTGNNAVLIPSMMQRRHGMGLTLRNWALVYGGNLAGALLFTYFMVHCCGLTAGDPWHSAAIRVAEAKVAMPWSTVFLKGIGANWCVCLAVWLALSGKTLFEKSRRRSTPRRSTERLYTQHREKISTRPTLIHSPRKRGARMNVPIEIPKFHPMPPVV